MNTIDWTEIVQYNGQLHPKWVRDVEVLYTGLHGQRVQRFRLGNGHRYIYKPLPPGTDRFREIAAYMQVMPLLSELLHPPRYPALIAYGAPHEQLQAFRQSLGQLTEYELPHFPNRANDIQHHHPEPIVHPACWIIVEDIGTLDHRHQPEVLEQVIDQMAVWHGIDRQQVEGLPQSGQKPPLDVAASSLLSRWDSVEEMVIDIMSPDPSTRLVNANTHQVDIAANDSHAPLVPIASMPRLVSTLRTAIGSDVPRITAQSPVLLHGDLHAGNYGMNPQGKLIVLDWEHSHAGSLFWDLYHLLDLSHPLFPRAMSSELRHRLLERYWLARQSSSKAEATEIKYIRSITADYTEFAQFEKDYLFYAIIYSIWMLLLIRNDLLQEPPIWPHALLLAQQYETEQHVVQCLVAWYHAS